MIILGGHGMNRNSYFSFSLIVLCISFFISLAYLGTASTAEAFSAGADSENYRTIILKGKFKKKGGYCVARWLPHEGAQRFVITDMVDFNAQKNKYVFYSKGKPVFQFNGAWKNVALHTGFSIPGDVPIVVKYKSASGCNANIFLAGYIVP